MNAIREVALFVQTTEEFNLHFTDINHRNISDSNPMSTW